MSSAKGSLLNLGLNELRYQHNSLGNGSWATRPVTHHTIAWSLITYLCPPTQTLAHFSTYVNKSDIYKFISDITYAMAWGDPAEYPRRHCKLGQWWPNVGKTVPTLGQRWANLYCYLGCLYTFAQRKACHEPCVRYVSMFECNSLSLHCIIRNCLISTLTLVSDKLLCRVNTVPYRLLQNHPNSTLIIICGF